ncbi:MAG: pantoate--beta-alanine ligase [Bacteroidetes bacterium RBG_19FT_COMBO_42_7]|nr:MAG: pantoate--beta-alanine ligase [Bacteroidetes bacterium RBG_19FT_COMBO_42_7]
MKVVSTIKSLQKAIKSSELSPLGLVPTMGALHKGHLSLVRNAMALCPQVVVSIFVNPTQFNDKKDLKNYPRCLNDDLNMLQEALRGDDLVFTPDEKEIYPVEDRRVFLFGNLENVMEALRRPGHFNGVGQVVSRLFDIVKPDMAFFGQKDFQQLAVIKELVRQTGSKVKIIGNPIIREDDGLAMSSRNRLLDPEIRKKAGRIYSTISAAANMINDHDIPYLVAYVVKNIEKSEGFKVEYFEIVDDLELRPVAARCEMKKEKRYYGCIAVKAGKIRLIDNIEIPL